ncbi:hypothetical protein [Marinitoga litoralis]|jgi:hypothetical protein|uniref:hypothetical protein n=1 Tax=Marinitoga litoralis TaxID=570855 RepID=UPI0019608A95|nr:hypothetical protein [Marinitoga litoralis]MBM7559030.1 hypothetical protein [Marinitoga litoralis]
MKKIITLILLSSIFILNSCSALFPSTKPLKVGDVVISQIDKDAIIEKTDNSYADIIKKLKKKDILIVFDGVFVGNDSSKFVGYKKANLNARKQLEEYLNSRKEIITTKVNNYMEKLNNKDSIIIEKIINLISKNSLISAKEVAKYYVVKDNNIEYHSVIVYDPLMIINTIEKSPILNYVEKAGGQSKELIDLLYESLK